MHEIITLSNGKRVANFSSPHPFTFEDGSILPAVSKEESRRLSVVINELPVHENSGDIELSFDLSEAIADEMAYWMERYYGQDRVVDVVYCPLMMITALKQEIQRGVIFNISVQHSPFRSIRQTDRIDKLVSISKQCI